MVVRKILWSESMERPLSNKQYHQVVGPAIVNNHEILVDDSECYVDLYFVLDWSYNTMKPEKFI